MAFVNLFVFQTVNTFFVFIVSGSLLDSLNEIIAHPTNVPLLLATAIPSQSNFFINYIALQTFIGHSIEITRISRVLLYWWNMMCCSVTKRDKLDAWKPTTPEYEVMYSRALLLFLVGISFSILSPLITPFVVIYFAYGCVVWNYQLLNVYIPEYDLGGKFWPLVFHRIMVATLVFQVLMAGVLTLKKMYWLSILILVLIVITSFFWWYISSRYIKASHYLSIADMQEKQVNLDMLHDIENSYIRNYEIPSLHEVSRERALNLLTNTFEQFNDDSEARDSATEEDSLLFASPR